MIGSKIYVVFREAQLLGLNFYASKIRVSTYQLPHTTSFSPTLVSRSKFLTSPALPPPTTQRCRPSATYPSFFLIPQKADRLFLFPLFAYGFGKKRKSRSRSRSDLMRRGAHGAPTPTVLRCVCSVRPPAHRIHPKFTRVRRSTPLLSFTQIQNPGQLATGG